MAQLKRRLRRIVALAIALSTVIGIGAFRNTCVVLRGADGFIGATLLWASSIVYALARPQLAAGRLASPARR